MHSDDPRSGGSSLPPPSASHVGGSGTDSTWLGTSAGSGSLSTIGAGGADTMGGDAGSGAPIPAPGARFDRFEVIRQLGAGAMGVVMLARDLDLDRNVAIKFLTPRAAAGEDANLRLLREAQAVARLQHPHIVAVHEVGRLGAGVFVVMEYVDGGTLRQWCAASPRGWQDIVDVYVQAARGLEAAHQLGLVHRDFKPDNALIGRDGRVRVSDFGLVAATENESVSASAPADDVTLTRTGAVLGTPAYMAPEQFAGANVGATADQFAFCVSLFEALYGMRPFGGTNAFEILGAIESGSIRALARIDVPMSIHGAIMRGLAKDPAMRHASLASLATILGGHATILRPAERPRGTVAAVAVTATVLVGVLAAAAWWAWPREPEPALPQVDAPKAAVRSAACEIEAGLATVWSSERRSVLVGIGHEAASLAAIDRRVAALLAGARTTCDAPPSDPVVAERMAACLWIEVDTTAGLVTALAEAPGPLVVARAATVVDSLFAPTTCTDPVHLAARGKLQWSEPTSDARRMIWRSNALAFAGEAERGAAVLAEIDDAVARLGDPGVSLVFASAQARAASFRNDLAGAEGGLRESLAHARALEDASYETIALTDLLEVDLRLGRGATEVEARVTALRSAIDRATPDVTWYGRAAIARVAANAGRVADADTELGVAIDLLASATWSRQTPLAQLLVERAGLRNAAGRKSEARADLDRATEALVSALGRDSAAFAERTITIAGQRLALDDLDQARRIIDASHSRLREAPPAIRQNVGDALYHFARVERSRGDLITAARRITEALAIAESIGAEERVAGYALLQAQIEIDRGHSSTAGDAATRAAAIADRYPRSTVIDRALLAEVRSVVALIDGDLASASRAMAERVAILEATGGSISLPVATASIALGSLSVALSDCGAASVAFEKARRIRERMSAPVDESVVDLLAGEAICLARDTEEEEARARVRELSAIKPSEVQQRLVKPAIAMVEAELALAAGEQEQAKTHATGARDGYRALGAEGEPWARVIEAWMSENLEGEESAVEDPEEVIEEMTAAKRGPAGH